MAMLETLRPHAAPFDWSRVLHSRWLWCVGAVLMLALSKLAQGPSELLNSLGDTDDATRLYQVRHLMAGGAWFDMTLPRLGGATALVSHWSRLIDLPLVILLGGFETFMTPAAAELAVRFVWPMLLLTVFLRILVRAADNVGGKEAAIFVLFLGLTCMSGLFQFRVGRIDHHNAMILGSIGGLMLLVHARYCPREGYWAGALIGIGLGVGYEPLAFLLPIVGLMALLAVWDLTWLRGVRNVAMAMLVTLAAIFVATVAPSLWFSARCDALSLNMVLLASGGACGLAVVDARGRGWSVAQRIAALTMCGAAGLVAYGALDTRCLSGPFSQVDAAIGAVWLNHVVETKSIFTFWATGPLIVLAFVASIAVGLWAAYARWRRQRTPESLVLLGMLVVIAPTGAWMIKLMPYASWVAVFCTALWIADLGTGVVPVLVGSGNDPSSLLCRASFRENRSHFSREHSKQSFIAEPGRPLQRTLLSAKFSALTRKLLAGLLCNQMTFAMLAVPLLTLTGTAGEKLQGDVAGSEGAACFTTPAIRSLQSLPRGLFVGSIDFGSYIVALTQHDALAAPYHRIDKAILINQALLAAEPTEAKRLIDDVHADYVVLCVTKTAAALVQGGAVGGFETLLRAGETIAFLTPLAIASPVAELRVWRVIR